MGLSRKIMYVASGGDTLWLPRKILCLASQEDSLCGFPGRYSMWLLRKILYVASQEDTLCGFPGG